MKEIIFYKYQSLGNDFIIIDDRKNILAFQEERIQQMCDRHFGIGADGIIFLRNSKKAQFFMQIFNSDGSEASMCGNGLASLAKFIFDEISEAKEIDIETQAGIYHAKEELKKVVVEAEYPKIIRKNLKLKIGTETVEMDYINSGALHVVLRERDLEKKDVIKMGKEIRYHDFFAKEGTNVNFIEVINDSQVRARVYERGVEGETLACGTGAIAIAATLAASEVEIFFRGGAVKIFKDQNRKIKIVLSPERVFCGHTGI